MSFVPCIGLIRGREIAVERPVEAGVDRYGAPIREWMEEKVENVLVTPGGTSDLDASRPEGARVALTLHFPKGYGEPLKECRVLIDGRPYRVIGDPHPHMDVNCPGPWNLTVEVEATDG